MRRAAGTAFMMAALVAAGASVSAQWARYPTPNVPRMADGKPNLTAPPPKTADGRVDLSGLWRGMGAVAGAAAGTTTPPPSGPPLATFRDIGANIPGGLPLTEAGRAVLKTRVAGNSKDNPEAHCLPMGIVQLYTQGAPRKFLQSPGELVILFEASSERREIFTDGRPLPTDDPQPWYNGYSAGRWEGDTLVVETVQFRDDGWLDIIGSPLSDAGKVTERIRRPTFGRMEIDITVEDKKMYTRPFSVRMNQQIMVDEELLEFVCLENQRFGK